MLIPTLILERASFSMQNTADFSCAFCGEPNTTFIDISGGYQQSYIEDCQVCCRPNVLYVRIDEDSLDIEIDTEYDG
ncbi:MAG: CPXCG motif-containing cysteine-rich protein [Elainellaceae cyanobacterium]